MSCITEITALHEVPGRVRFFVPQIKSSPANAATLKDYLKKIPGIFHAKTCPHLGTLIVYFDTAEVSRASLHDHIHDCELPEMIVGPTHAPAPIQVRHRISVKRTQSVNTRTNSGLLIALVKQGLLASGGNYSGSLGLGMTALRTLLAVARAH